MKRAAIVLLCVIMAAGALGVTACAGETAHSSYRMALEYTPETRTLTGEMTVQAVNTGENAQDVLRFHLWANAYREGASPVSELFAPAAYYNGESYGGI